MNYGFCLCDNRSIRQFLGVRQWQWCQYPKRKATRNKNSLLLPKWYLGLTVWVMYFILHCVLNVAILRAIIAYICLQLAGFPCVSFQPHEIGSASNLHSIVTSSLINVESDQKPREHFSLILASAGGAFILARKCADFARTWRRNRCRST